MPDYDHLATLDLLCPNYGRSIAAWMQHDLTLYQAALGACVAVIGVLASVIAYMYLANRRAEAAKDKDVVSVITSSLSSIAGVLADLRETVKIHVAVMERQEVRHGHSGRD